MAPEPEPSFLGELASGIWAGLKVSVPGLALAAVWLEGTLPRLAKDHAAELAATVAVMLVIHLLSDARCLRRTIRKARGCCCPDEQGSAGRKAEAAALPEGWASSTMEDGTPFWYHKDRPAEAVFERPRVPRADGQPRLDRPSSDDSRPVPQLADFGLSEGLGCLLPPPAAGSALLPAELEAVGEWEAVAKELPTLLAEPDGCGAAVAQLPGPDEAALAALAAQGGEALQRARLVLAFLAQGCLAGPKGPAAVPSWMATAWAALHKPDKPATVPPLRLSYSTYVLCNCGGRRGRRAPLLSLTGCEEEKGLLESLLALEVGGGEALAAAVALQEAAAEWDSEGVQVQTQLGDFCTSRHELTFAGGFVGRSTALKQVQAVLCDLALVVRERLLAPEAKAAARSEAGQRLRRVLMLPHSAGGSEVLRPDGIFLAIAVLLGINEPEQGSEKTAAEAKSTPAPAAVAGDGRWSPTAFRRGIEAGPSVAGFARHCWDALEGAASGDCPFVGTREYAVLEAYDKCALALSELHAAYGELQAHFMPSAQAARAGRRKKVAAPKHTPFLDTLPPGPPAKD